MPKKIKILQLVEALNSGGMERVIATLACGLDKGKYDVEVWCLAQGGDIAQELLDREVTLKILNISNYHNPFSMLKLILRLKKARPDILHMHGYFASTAGRITGKLAGVSILITHVHSTYWWYKKRHIVMERLLSHITHKIICCSKAVEEFVQQKEAIKPSKTVVIYNGIDENRFNQPKDTSAIRQALTIKLSDQVVGIVASLTPQKGHTYFLEAACKILDVLPHAKFLIVGDGILRKELEQKAYDLNIAVNVIFTGERKDIPDLLSIMDVIILSSHIREGMPISLLEAMAAARPVVATNIGGIPEVIVDGQTGLLVEPQNSQSLASATINLLKDRDYALALGENGKQRFSQFDSKTMIDKIEELYDYCLEKKMKNR